MLTNISKGVINMEEIKKKNIDESPVKQLREKAGVTQRQMADALEVHHSLIASLEAGVIELDDEDLVVKNKVRKVFETLAEWTGMSKQELINNQIKFTNMNAMRLKSLVREQLRKWVALQWGGSEQLADEEEVKILLELMYVECEEKCISPVTWFRENASITQRQLALATGVSQTFIARLELGEVELFGPKTGSKVLEFICEALLSHENDPLYDELYSGIYECQQDYIKNVAKQSKDKVKNALQNLREKDKDNKNKE